MTQEHTIRFKVHVAWWVKPYLVVLQFFCDVMGTGPDPIKLFKKISSGLSVRLEK